MITINARGIKMEYAPRRILNFNGPEVGKTLLELYKQISFEGANYSDDYEAPLSSFLDIRELTLRQLEMPDSILSPNRNQSDVDRLSSRLQIPKADVVKILSFIDLNIIGRN